MNDTDTDASVSVVGVDHDVLVEGVDQAVPEHVDEAVAVSCDHPAQAVSLSLLDSVPLGLVEQLRLESGRMECVDLAIREPLAPRVGDVAVLGLNV